MGGGQHSEQHRGEGEQSADKGEDSFNSFSFLFMILHLFYIYNQYILHIYISRFERVSRALKVGFFPLQ